MCTEGTLLSRKEEASLAFAATWMDREDFIEVKDVKRRKTGYL